LATGRPNAAIGASAVPGNVESTLGRHEYALGSPAKPALATVDPELMVSEALDVRLPFMSQTVSTHDRPTDQVREAARLTHTLAASLGQTVRTGRLRKRITERELSDRVGVDQSRISQIELGRGDGAPLSLWIAIGVALDQPLAVSFTRPLAEARQPADAGHLEMQEFLLGLAGATGRSASFELPTRPADPSRSIDVGVRDARHRILIIEEAWNTFGDFGGAIRATHRKAAEAADLAATIDDGPPYQVATVWVVRASAANRALVGRYPEVVASAFPGSSRRWAEALTSGGVPPRDPGIIWYDPATRRIHEWRHRTAPY
jgi:transcriptional regulator with XRE-family HTH domain